MPILVLVKLVRQEENIEEKRVGEVTREKGFSGFARQTTTKFTNAKKKGVKSSKHYHTDLFFLFLEQVTNV